MGFGNLFKKRQAEFTEAEITCIGGIAEYCRQNFLNSKTRSRMQAAGLEESFYGGSTIGKWLTLERRIRDPKILSYDDYKFVKNLLDFALAESAAWKKWLGPMRSVEEYNKQYQMYDNTETQARKILEKLWFVL